MKRLMILMIACFLIACSEAIVNTANCSTEATVRNLTGLDGCGFVFELKNGVRLEPLRLAYCGTPPLPIEVTNDPLFNFQFVDGKKVKIQFEETNAASICMVGLVVKITCITELSQAGD
jgi:hypothetical protein